MAKPQAKAAGRTSRAAQVTTGSAEEIAGLVLGLLVLGLLISVASYSPDDPPNSTGAAGAVHNLCGTIGAYVADLAMFCFGYGSYLLVVWAAMATFRRFRPVPLGIGFLEGTGFLVGTVSLCLLLSRLGLNWNESQATAHVERMWGGMLGYYLVAKGTVWLGDWGSVLAALAGLTAAIILTTRLSLRDVLGVAGAGLRHLLNHGLEAGGEVMRGLKEHWLERRDSVAAGGRINPPVKPGRDGREKKGGAGKAPAGGDPGPAGTFPVKPEKPKIHRPESEPETDESPAADGKVISLDKKKREREQAAKGRRPDADEAKGTDGDGAGGGEAAASAPARPAEPEATPIYATDDYDPAAYQLPSLALLAEPEAVVAGTDDAQMISVADLLVKTLMDFGIEAKVDTITPGPVVTLYELLPAAGVPVNKFVSRQDDLKLALAAKSIRIVAPIPGKAAVGIEVPNKLRANVFFREVAETAKFRACPGLLKVALGKDALGLPNFLELDKMPHLLVAGATGSGKTVCIHGIVTSLLFNAKPHELKFVLIDPKQVEMTMYRDIPHLLTPIINDVKDATRALKWLCLEMDGRYDTLAAATCRDITRYNDKMREQQLPVMPYIVLVIDELADLMAVGAQECEIAISRLTAKSRAVGIHLVLATQRPSVDVITGLIKANLPARIAFNVLAKVDSRTILDQNGAETLLGTGDMLFLDPKSPAPSRMQGAFLRDAEIEAVADFVKRQGKPHYHIEVTRSSEVAGAQALTDEDMQYYEDAKRIIIRRQKGSIMLLQRMLKVSYPRAQRLMDQMEKDGIVGPSEGPKARKVLVTYKDYYGEEAGDGAADDELEALNDEETDGDGPGEDNGGR